jgi:hypothetical protein
LTADIQRYSISLDKIEKVSSLITPTRGGLALQSNDGKSIYHFGGLSSRTVHNFNIETNVTLALPTALPYSLFASSGVSVGGTHFIFNAAAREVWEYSEELQTVKIIGDLPFQYGWFPVMSTAAIRTADGGVWLFAGNDPKAPAPVILFNVTTKDVNNQVANTTYLPTLYEEPASVSDGKHGYLIGGLGRLPEADGSYYPTNGILR